MPPTKVAIIGSGNIGSDLMMKVIRLSESLEMGAMVGIDPASDGLARAKRLGIPTTAEGVDGLIGLPNFDEIDVVFDATSARAHVANAEKHVPHGKILIDLTPAAIGPFVLPAVNLDAHGRDRRLRRLHRLEVRRPGHPGEHRRVHRDHRASIGVLPAPAPWPALCAERRKTVATYSVAAVSGAVGVVMIS
jgi:hypothetical protein